eukprot:2677358-Pyramimonas_sp.AAC.1
MTAHGWALPCPRLIRATQGCSVITGCNNNLSSYSLAVRKMLDCLAALATTCSGSCLSPLTMLALE